MNTLNAEQMAVVNDRTSPVIAVLASPGSGKSHTLIEKVLDCAAHHDPCGFVVVCFSNAAAKELTERLHKRDPKLQLGFVGTLHSWCMRLIQRHGRLIGLANSFTLVDEQQREDILAGIIKQHGVKVTKKAVEQAVKAAVYTNIGGRRLTGAELVAADFHQQMRSNGTYSFDSLLTYAAMLIERGIPDQPTHLFTDEGQDSSAADFRIYQALPAKFKFFVGDEKQAIYSFRGGDVKQFEAVAKSPCVTTYTLNLNYRSGRRICAAANRLIAHNGHSGEMTAAQDIEGEIDVWDNAPNSIASLQMIASDITDWSQAGQPPSVAVLFRYNAHVEEAVKYFQSQNIPLARRDDVVVPADWRKAMALLGALENPYNDMAMRYYLKVSIPTSMDAIIAKAADNMTSINDQYFHWPDIGANHTATQLVVLLDVMTNENVSNESQKKIVDAWNDLANQSLSDLIYALANERSQRTTGQGVFVGTFHGAKGLEFDSVYIGAFEQSITPGTKTGDALQEERRLAYVASTRARRRLVLCAAKFRAPLFATRAVEQEVSQFVKEMGCA